MHPSILSRLYVAPVCAAALLVAACASEPSSNQANPEPSSTDVQPRDVVRVSESWLRGTGAQTEPGAEEVEAFYLDILGQVPDDVERARQTWTAPSKDKAEVLLAMATQAMTWGHWDIAQRSYRALLTMPEQAPPTSQLIYRLFLAESQISGDQELIGNGVDKYEALQSLIGVERLAGTDSWSPHLSYRIALVAYKAGAYDIVVERLLPVLRSSKGSSDQFLHHTRNFCGTVAYLTVVSMVELGRSGEAQSVLDSVRGYDACLTPDFLNALEARAPILDPL